MQTRGATGSSDWKRYVIELPVDASVKNINFGMLMPGDGAAWFDALTIELDGQPYTDKSILISTSNPLPHEGSTRAATDTAWSWILKSHRAASKVSV